LRERGVTLHPDSRLQIERVPLGCKTTKKKKKEKKRKRKTEEENEMKQIKGEWEWEKQTKDEESRKGRTQECQHKKQITFLCQKLLLRMRFEHQLAGAHIKRHCCG
jgi:hypothetical protein